jgi:hypothetical protein
MLAIFRVLLLNLLDCLNNETFIIPVLHFDYSSIVSMCCVVFFQLFPIILYI